jgi:hypothetical protein
MFRVQGKNKFTDDVYEFEKQLAEFEKQPVDV